MGSDSLCQDIPLCFNDYPTLDPSIFLEENPTVCFSFVIIINAHLISKIGY